MSHFTFRLDAVLRTRENRRDRFRGRLARAVAEEERFAGLQAALDERRRKLASQYREASAPGALDVVRLIDCRRYDRLLAVEQQRLEERRRRTTERIARRRAALLAADREVRVLEKLEAKQADRHRQEQTRRESRILDEVAATHCSP
ncbi:MAG TPA: flagellar export protein FliJ [Thermoguttaceae bacterium]|nr:flagellar export protein FliJ [Thermoguttaceae bacterium]